MQESVMPWGARIHFFTLEDPWLGKLNGISEAAVKFISAWITNHFQMICLGDDRWLWVAEYVGWDY